MAAASEAEERAQFTLTMRARGIRDIELLRALERVPRALFMPQRYADIAWRDLALPIACGQTSTPPSIIAAMIAALGPSRADRVYEIGAGTGYATALLAQLAGEVVSVERCQPLAVEAAARLKAFGVENATVTWADGLSAPASPERFGRIIAHGLVEPPAEVLASLIADGGVMVAPIQGYTLGEQRIVRFEKAAGGGLSGVDVANARTFRPLTPGLSRAI